MIFAVLAVKDPRFANQRLSKRLSPKQREGLARVMFGETLSKLLEAKRIGRVVVVSSDERALATAAEAGAMTLAEDGQHSHSQSADNAALWCAEQGAGRVLLAPIDVPLATPADFDDLAEASISMGDPSLVIVPSRDSTGTNSLLQSPPGVIGCRFGPGSYRLHRDAAEAVGAQVTTRRPEGLTFDIDTPADLDDFLRVAPEGPTQRFLSSRDGEGL